MAFIANITFAAESPSRLAAFWAAALDYEVPDAPPVVQELIEKGELDPDAASAAIDPTGKGPRLFFERKAKTPERPMPIHLDIHFEDREAGIARLLELGATLVQHHERSFGDFTERWTEMRDPEGNGFCVQ